MSICPAMSAARTILVGPSCTLRSTAMPFACNAVAIMLPSSAPSVSIFEATTTGAAACAVAAQRTINSWARSWASRSITAPLWRRLGSVVDLRGRPHRFDRFEQLVGAERLLDHRVGAQKLRHVERVGGPRIAAARDRYDLHIVVLATNGQDRLDAFLLRHVDVGDDQLGVLAMEQLHAARAV